MSVIGVGSPFGDDRLGWIAVEALRRSAGIASLKPEAIRIDARDRPGFLLLSAWRGARTAILVDAVCTGAEPGTLLRLAGDAIVTRGGTVSTHGFGVALAVELARALNQMPSELVLLGLEADPRHSDASLSLPVQAAMPAFVRLIEQEVLAAAG